MASQELLRFIFLYFTIPFFIWISIIIALAAFGKSCGVRRLYIKILLFIFEWGKKRIKKHQLIQDKEHAAKEGGRFDAIEEVSAEVEADTEDTNEAFADPGKATGNQATLATGAQDSPATSDSAIPTRGERASVITGDLVTPATGDQATPSMDNQATHKAAYSMPDKALPNGDTHEQGHLIQREIEMSSKGTRMRRQYSISEETVREFKLADITYFCKSGIEAIIEDEVTQRFSAEELSSWNLLTRTNTKHEFISVRLTLLWMVGWVLRYIILFPFRLILAMYAIGLLIVGTAVIGTIPDAKKRRWWYIRLNLMCYRVMGRAFSAIVNFHNKENRAKGGGICVANHTSPIDIIILSADNTYAMVGQSQPGFIGLIQRAMSRAEAHVWFDRAESRDRLAVARRLKEHVEDKNKLPILIFPEGTCINNTSIMMFKKGSFEVGGIIYPVAIKYDPRFADAFWNSSQQGFVKHLLMIMTSWALVCDVWYLPPEYQKPGEDAVHFANRVKANIAAQGGLVDLEWDGGLKRSHPKASMMQKQQEEYSKKLKGE